MTTTEEAVQKVLTKAKELNIAIRDAAELRLGVDVYVVVVNTETHSSPQVKIKVTSIVGELK